MDVCSDIHLPDIVRDIEKEVMVLSEPIGAEQGGALPAATVLMAN